MLWGGVFGVEAEGVNFSAGNGGEVVVSGPVWAVVENRTGWRAVVAHVGEVAEQLVELLRRGAGSLPEFGVEEGEAAAGDSAGGDSEVGEPA